MVMQKNHTNSYTFLTLYIPIDQFEGWDSNARIPTDQALNLAPLTWLDILEHLLTFNEI